jgi:adenosyl cobinamide kinase/adenosyl cobinamide phosphate guanylyltransferase
MQLGLIASLVFGGAHSFKAFAAEEAADSSTERSVDLAPASVSTARETDLAPAERLAQGQEIVVAIEAASQAIQRQLQSARKDRDVVRVLCLNDKLNQVDVALSSAQDRLGSLRTAIEHSDADRARHEYTVLEVLNDRARVLVNESNQCVGEETGFIGEAEVSVSVDPNLPDPDTTTDPGSNTPPPPPDIVSPIE